MSNFPLTGMTCGVDGFGSNDVSLRSSRSSAQQTDSTQLTSHDITEHFKSIISKYANKNKNSRRGIDKQKKTNSRTFQGPLNFKDFSGF